MGQGQKAHRYYKASWCSSVSESQLCPPPSPDPYPRLTDCVQILESQWLSQAGFPRQVYGKRTKNSSFHHPPAPINEPAPAESLSSLSSSLAYLDFTSENRPELGCSCPHTVAFPECLCPCIPPLGKQWQSTFLLWTSPNIPSLVWSHRKGQPAS